MTWSNLVRPTTNQETVTHRNGGVPQILQTIFMAGKLAPSFTRRLAKEVEADSKRQTLKNAWSFVRNNIEYKRDKSGKEVVKSPGKLVFDGQGDCKSFTIMLVSLMENLGIPWKYRVAFYDPANPEQGHIYPVALVGNREIIVDAVHTRFDEEVGYWRAVDYDTHGRQIAALNGATVIASQPWNWKKLLTTGALTWIVAKALKII